MRCRDWVGIASGAGAGTEVFTIWGQKGREYENLAMQWEYGMAYGRLAGGTQKKGTIGVGQSASEWSEPKGRMWVEVDRWIGG